MAKIFDINRPNNKITLGTTGTTINIASHTASLLLSLDASKNLESVSDLTSWVAGTANQITVTDNTDGTLTLSLPSDIIISGTSTPSIIIQSTDASDPTLIFKTTNTTNQINISLDESQSKDQLIIAGQTASQDTVLRVVAQDGEQGEFRLYSGTFYSYLRHDADDDLVLANQVNDGNFILRVRKGVTGINILWDANADQFRHSAGVFNFDSGMTIGDGGTTNYTGFAIDGTQTFNGTARIDWTKITANGVTLADGPPTSGDTVNDLQTAHDGNTYTISEIAGNAGQNLIVDFTGVTAFNWIQILGRIEEQAGHVLTVQLEITPFDDSAWHTYHVMKNQTADQNFENYSFFVPNDSAYINSGVVKVRFIHEMNGNANDEWVFDVVALYQ